MSDKPESKKQVDDLHPGKTVCANPRYGGLTIAEAMRRIISPGYSPEEAERLEVYAELRRRHERP